MTLKKASLFKWLTSFVLIPILVVGGVVLFCSVPFFYPSQTLWYKIGVDKTLLLTGQLAGLLCLFFLLLQVLLGVRVKLLENCYGTPLVMKTHRFLGKAMLLLGLIHVGFVLLPEGLYNLPIGWKYWPEGIGATLLLALLVQVLSSILRDMLKFGYRPWRIVHRILAYTMVLLATVHVLFVTDSFGFNLPGKILPVLVLIVLFWVGWQWYCRLQND